MIDSYLRNHKLAPAWLFYRLPRRGNRSQKFAPIPKMLNLLRDILQAVHSNQPNKAPFYIVNDKEGVPIEYNDELKTYTKKTSIGIGGSGGIGFDTFFQREDPRKTKCFLIFPLPKYTDKDKWYSIVSKVIQYSEKASKESKTNVQSEKGQTQPVKPVIKAEEPVVIQKEVVKEVPVKADVKKEEPVKAEVMNPPPVKKQTKKKEEESKLTEPPSALAPIRRPIQRPVTASVTSIDNPDLLAYIVRNLRKNT
jgi:hypothetical protein